MSLFNLPTTSCVLASALTLYMFALYMFALYLAGIIAFLYHSKI